MSTSTKCTYVLNASSKGETAQMHKLALALVARICNITQHRSCFFLYKINVCVVESCHVTYKTDLGILGNCVNKATCQTGGNNLFHWLLRLGKEQGNPELIDTSVKFI